MRKRILVIDGHPDPDRARLCHALTEAYAKSARDAGHETRVITIAEAEFPLLRQPHDFESPPETRCILTAQQDLLWAHHIVLIFPLWLGGAPALLSAFLEQVARGRFVADTRGGRIERKLAGKSARLIVTMGMPAFIYRIVFHAHGVRRITQSVLAFAGVTPVRTTFLGAVEASASKARDWLTLVRQLGSTAA